LGSIPAVVITFGQSLLPINNNNNESTDDDDCSANNANNYSSRSLLARTRRAGLRQLLRAGGT
jgi:hypothetical protein